MVNLPRIHASVTLLLLFLPAFSYAQEPQEIISRFLNSTSGGDINNWNKVTSVYMESENLFLNDTLNNQGNFNVKPKKDLQKLYRVWPDKSMTEVFEGSVLVSAFYHVKKKHFYVMKGMDPIEIGTGPYEPYFEFEPMMIKHVVDKSNDIKLLGIRRFDHDDFYDIRITTKDLIWHFFFHVDNSLLGYWENSADDKEETLTRVYDYQKLDGFLIATSETKWRQGKSFFGSKRKKIVLNAEINPEQFNYKKETPSLRK